ncbi:16S rRNA (guanine(966)-N(2))-methyltransferase RsmD [Collibacillus ludicampi]|uniref:16S rRNA (guanine(966)-N(2))-methyltransferase RsmD n=1 Tax=Collibacillus ludicampi TaxID=2771369 RepID=UPI003F7237C6
MIFFERPLQRGVPVMRIIAGLAKGRRLQAVPGRTTRPTSDRVKESIFSIIGPFWQDGVVLDLFAGTGALGIEALSRGMEKAVFIDQDAKALHVIKENLRLCGFVDRAEVYRQDARKALQILARHGRVFDLIFLDPPYRLHIIPDLIDRIEQHALLRSGGVLVAEHAADIELPLRFQRVEQFRHAVYGDTAISFYRKD